MIIKPSEIDINTETLKRPVLQNNETVVLKEGEKLYFKGNREELFKFIAALTTDPDYCGLEINRPKRVIYRDLYCSTGGLTPFLSDMFKKINREDAYEKVLVHKDDPYCVWYVDGTEPYGIYSKGDVVILDFGRHSFLKEREIYKYVREVSIKNEGAVIIFTAPSETEEYAALESTAHTIVEVKTMVGIKGAEVNLIGRNFASFKIE